MEELDPVVRELKIVKEENNLSYRKLAQEMGIHYQTVYGWFTKGRLSNMSRRIIKQYLISKL